MLCLRKICRVLFAAVLLLKVCSAADVDDLEAKCRASASCKKEIDGLAASLEKTKAGVETAKELATLLGDTNLKPGIDDFSLKCSNIFGKIGKYLAVAGPLAELVGSFFTSTQEQQLGQIIDTLRKEFVIVNQRFDNVFVKLFDMTSLIRDQHLRTQYRDAKDGIIHATKLMYLMLNAPKGAVRGYKKQVKEYEGKALIDLCGNSLQDGLRDETRFLKVFMAAEDSNRKRVHARLMTIYSMISQAAKFYLFWLELKAEDSPLDYTKVFRTIEKERYEKELQENLEHIKRFDKEQFIDQWENKFEKDFLDQVIKGGTNSDVADRAYDYLQGKYDWRQWLVVIYNPVMGWDHHTVYQRGGVKIFRWNNRWNLYVAHVNHINRGSESQTRALLLQAVTGTYENLPDPGVPGTTERVWVKVDDAKKVYDTYPQPMPGMFGGVIRSTADVQARPPHRTVREDKDGMTLIVMQGES